MLFRGIIDIILLIIYWGYQRIVASTELNNPKKSSSLHSVVQKAAGLFVDPAKQAGYERTVLVTGCNYGFLNHLQNFKCFADRLGMKFLVIAMDEKAFQHLSQSGDMLVYYMSGSADVASATAVTSDSVTFRSKQFNLITARKKEAVHDILVLGYDVLFSDTDVAIVRNPLPYLIWRNVDYVHSLNAWCQEKETWDFRRSKEEGNTGFYFVRSNNRTIKLWADAYAAMPKFPGLDDQAVFWNVIRHAEDPPIYPLGKCRNLEDTEKVTVSYGEKKKNNKNKNKKKQKQKQKQKQKEVSVKDVLTTCVLDACVFSSGMISRYRVPEFTYERLLENLKLHNETICTLHANYMKGNLPKMERMRAHGFWLSVANDGGSNHAAGSVATTNTNKRTCIDFVPTAGNFTNK
jgi:Nucleotide-diphospho-sugar transferase